MKIIKNLVCLFQVCLVVLGLWFSEAQLANAETTNSDSGTPAIVCESLGQRLPNPDDKSSFYQCAYADSDGSLRPVLQNCPMETATTRLVFDPELEVCNWSTDVPSS
ncbi:chitin binding peritrophin-A domain-containing protein [Nostoc sp. UIC 10890]